MIEYWSWVILCLLSGNLQSKNVVDTLVKPGGKSYQVHTSVLLEQSYWVNVVSDKEKYTHCFLYFQDFAIQVIKSTHNHWKDLISQKTKAGELSW